MLTKLRLIFHYGLFRWTHPHNVKLKEKIEELCDNLYTLTVDHIKLKQK